MSSESILGQASAPGQSKLRERTLWTVQIVTALFFAAAAVSKLAGAEYNVIVFEKVGYGQWFRYVTGFIELSGAILVVVPRLAALGGAILAAVMTGAFFADLHYLDGNGVPALICFAVTASIAWLRRSSLPPGLRWPLGGK